jgi:hypothetical protein
MISSSIAREKVMRVLSISEERLRGLKIGGPTRKWDHLFIRSAGGCRTIHALPPAHPIIDLLSFSTSSLCLSKILPTDILPISRKSVILTLNMVSK